MTKKELETLHSQKATAIQVPADLARGKTTRTVLCLSLTPGELLALHHMISKAASAWQEDVRDYINNALQRADIDINA
jgi:hypothetical protein